jgi:hypothetical protein
VPAIKTKTEDCACYEGTAAVRRSTSLVNRRLFGSMIPKVFIKLDTSSPCSPARFKPASPIHTHWKHVLKSALNDDFVSQVTSVKQPLSADLVAPSIVAITPSMPPIRSALFKHNSASESLEIYLSTITIQTGYRVRRSSGIWCFHHQLKRQHIWCPLYQRTTQTSGPHLHLRQSSLWDSI